MNALPGSLTNPRGLPFASRCLLRGTASRRRGAQFAGEPTMVGSDALPLRCAPPGRNRPQGKVCRQRRQNGPPQTRSITQRVSRPRHKSQPSRRALGRRAAPTSRPPRFCPQIVPMAWAALRKAQRKGRSFLNCGLFQKARTTGLEPATTGSTVRYSNQLSYVPNGSSERLIIFADRKLTRAHRRPILGRNSTASASR